MTPWLIVPHRNPSDSIRGFFGIGVYHPKTEGNIGTLWRHADLYRASWLFTIGQRYRRQATDTTHAADRVPLYHYPDVETFLGHLPLNCEVVCVELTPDATPLPRFTHPERAVYLLGAEDHGLPPELLMGRRTVVVPTSTFRSMNVATAGTIIMYDRHVRHLTAVEARRRLP